MLSDLASHYRTLVESIHEVLYTVGADGVIQYISPQLSNAFPYEPDQVIGRHYSDFIHPEDTSSLREKTFSAGTFETITAEVRVLGADGAVHWIQLSATPVFEKGRLKDVCGTLTDITERKRKENALRESEAKLTSIINTCTDVFVLLNRDWTIAMCNEKCAANLGISLEEAVGAGPDELKALKGQISKSRMSVISQVFETGKPVRFQDKRDGRYLDHSVSPVFDADGQVKQVAVFAREYTELHLMSEALKHSVSKYRFLVDHSPDIIVSIDAQGSVTFINRVVSKLGYTEEELLYKNISTFLAPRQESFHPDLPTIDEMMKEGHNIEVTLIDAAGHRRQGLMSIYELTPGELARHNQSDKICIIRDITERIVMQKEKTKLEASLARAEKIAAMGQLTSKMTHEINNTLDVIHSKVYLLEKDLEQVLNPAAERRLKSIKDQLYRIGAFSESLLDFVRPGGSMTELVPLNDIILRVIDDCTEQKLVPGVSFELNLNDSLPGLLGRPLNIEVVIRNLILNSMEAMETKGRIAVATGTNERGEIVCTISDNGPGIDPGIKDNLFDQFFTTKGSRGGSGLGLGICRDLIEAHSGRLTLENNESGGATAVIILPAAE